MTELTIMTLVLTILATPPIAANTDKKQPPAILQCYPGYLVLGHYIRHHLDWSMAKRRAIGLVCLILGTSVTLASFYVQAIPGAVQDIVDLEIAWCFCTVNCAIATFGAFILFTTLRQPGKCYPLVRSISTDSYGMYLIHLIWLPVMFSLLSPLLPIGWAIPAITMATYAACYLSVHLLSYLPKAQWFVGCAR